jgi:hypothetical protein
VSRYTHGVASLCSAIAKMLCQVVEICLPSTQRWAIASGVQHLSCAAPSATGAAQELLDRHLVPSLKDVASAVACVGCMLVGPLWTQCVTIFAFHASPIPRLMPVAPCLVLAQVRMWELFGPYVAGYIDVLLGLVSLACLLPQQPCLTWLLFGLGVVCHWHIPVCCSGGATTP